MNKPAIGIIAVVLIVGSFYGGMVYGKSSTQNAAANRRGNFTGANFPGGLGGGMGANRNNNGVTGDILSVSQNSLTVKLRDGGSKIVVFGPSTTVRAIQDVPVNSLQIGKSIIVNGSANADGSVTAQVIQVRDASSTPFGGGFQRPPQQ